MSSIQTYDYFDVAWGGRGETPDEAAPKLLQQLELVSAFDNHFGDWYVSNTKKRTREQVAVDEKTVLQLLSDEYERARRKKDYMEGEGYLLSLTSTKKPSSCAVTLVCGQSGPVFTSSCSITFDPTKTHDHIFALPGFLRLVHQTVELWNPSWGSVSNLAFAEAVDGITNRKIGPLIPSVGWLTYLRADRGALPHLPEPVHVHAIPNYGHVILVNSKTARGNVEADAQTAATVQTALESAGVMKPLP